MALGLAVGSTGRRRRGVVAPWNPEPLAQRLRCSVVERRVSRAREQARADKTPVLGAGSDADALDLQGPQHLRGDTAVGVRPGDHVDEELRRGSAGGCVSRAESAIPRPPRAAIRDMRTLACCKLPFLLSTCV